MRAVVLCAALFVAPLYALTLKVSATIANRCLFNNGYTAVRRTIGTYKTLNVVCPFEPTVRLVNAGRGGRHWPFFKKKTARRTSVGAIGLAIDDDLAL
jgi:hypothetical protein